MGIPHVLSTSGGSRLHLGYLEVFLLPSVTEHVLPHLLALKALKVHALPPLTPHPHGVYMGMMEKNMETTI